MSNLRLFILIALSAVTLSARSIELTIPKLDLSAQSTSIWLALDVGAGFGSTAVSVDAERRVFLAFQADLVLQLNRYGEVLAARHYKDYRWQAMSHDGIAVTLEGNQLKLSLPAGDPHDRARAVQWFTVSDTGDLAPEKQYITRRANEVYLPFYYVPNASGGMEPRGRYGVLDARPVIYQMLPRLFGNENETRKVNGTLAENGSGKFSDLSESVLHGLRSDGFSHIWLTGLLQQATSTDYREAGQRADDPDLLKGIAGSPYAIRDYFDVSPDYADEPTQRLQEFKALAARMQAAYLKVIIDFVPNHVARSYASDIRPELAFGVNDRQDVYFDSDNNFYYLTKELTSGEAPLRLPTVDPKSGQIINETACLVGNADGYFAPENVHGRVTGNNVVSWRPSNGDWYETIKLNYGFDFLNRDAPPQYPSAVSPRARIPDTWKKMDAIIAYWQRLGVDGFRADMAHMVPPEFWKWLIHRARERNSDVLFFAEAYNDDPAKVPGHDPAIPRDDNVMLALLDAGFHAVYDDPAYDSLEHLYTGKAWANDLQYVEEGLGAFFFDCALRYAENHDEIRLAHPDTWGGQGMEVGRPVTATLFGLSRGAVMLYHGQEVGEPGLGREGFGGDDQRTTIFDYWSLPELNKWWNHGAADGGQLSSEQSELRAWYVRLLQLQSEPAFTRGNALLLNEVNRDNPFYGKVADVGPSGHWFFAYLRSDPESQSHYLITTNFHANATLRHVRVRLPESAITTLGLSPEDPGWLVLRDRLAGEALVARAVRVADAVREGIYLDGLEPQSCSYWSIEKVDTVPAGVVQSPSVDAGTAFLGAPPLLRARAGSELRLDLRRFGDPGASHAFRVESSDMIQARIDRINHVLYLKVSEAARGLQVLPFSLEPRQSTGARMLSSLPLAIEAVTTQKFRIEGHEQAASVSLVGDFNHWNDAAHSLHRVEGGWEVITQFQPGRYLYKYVIEGAWLPDPTQQSRESDGYGGFNSVLEVVGDAGANRPAATLFVKAIEEKSILLQANQKLSLVHAEALPEDGGVVALTSEVEGDRVRVSLHGAAPGTLVRILVENAVGKVGLPVIAYAGEPSRDIWRDDIIYYAFTDRFYDGEASNSQTVADPKVLPAANYQGGDFQGIEQKLNAGYFEELGVNVLWLAPLNQNPAGSWQEYLEPFRHYTGYHGYWPVERFGVEKRFGGESALLELISAAHDDGMKVLSDLVLKHVHVENPVRQERPELFGQLELSDGSRNLRRWNDNPYTTWFEPFLPAFDFRNPATVEYLLEDATYWIDHFNLDGYRLDAVKHIRPDFWWRFRTRIRDTYPSENLYFVGETFQDRQGISDFVGPNMLDGQFDFPLYDVLVPCFAQEQLGFDQLESALRESEEVYGRTVRMSALLGNHDKSRFMAYADGDLPSAAYPDDEEAGWAQTITVDHDSSYDKLKLAMTFLLTIDGVPMIYYGDEIGMTGAGDPDNRRMMRFGQDVSAAEASVKMHFSKLAKARRAHPSLFLGSRRVLVASEDQYAYVRKYAEDVALVAFNRSDEVQRYVFELAPELEDAFLSDVLSAAELNVHNGRLVFQLAPMQSAVFVNVKGADVP
ncbi:alpha-amylase family glycosyl hydrolase [Coraliomargarita algicola]|uniref:Alpha-amylase family glycosyl hydrolase n=1 Tax=Coraliomargarita algicola TaxID=3092156 RepID=A0ABZ0RP88_9BACT|nr:alpha-amylase family glycosyl hydrolase [Coraliomargarita sp. J2-16]WPJ98036.1 alpha-amylase family glycosyl hydrolase [Coraliomargarita sp. J2-16]